MRLGFKDRNKQPRRSASPESGAGHGVDHSRRGAEPAVKRGEDEFSIAVLPFADLTADQRRIYLCDALADQIIHALAKIPKLRVRARPSRLQSEDVREIGRRLKVDCVLEGSVQEVEKRVRLNLQLVSTFDGLDVWGDTYDRPLENVSGIGDEITQGVVEGLEATLFPADNGRLTSRAS